MCFRIRTWEATLTISLRKKLIGVAGSATLVFGLAACGEAPPTTTPNTEPAATGTATDAPTEAPGDVIEGFKACMVSDEGGFDDKSFNELGYKGLMAAAEELGIETSTTESKSANDFASNLDGLVADNCNLIISVGYLLSAPTVKAATANPDVHFAIIDDWADNDFDGTTDAPNIKPLVFDTAQAAFLGGYAAASFSETGTVGTFGGGKIPPVTIFMDGFTKGVDHYNQEKGAGVKVLGWDVAKQDGLFTGGFEANDNAKQIAQGLIDQGADVILPVGGPIYQSAAQAIRDSGEGLSMLGVDSDLAVSDPSIADLILVSIRKAMDVAVHEAVVEAATGNFDTTPFVGTLENEGVLLSGFHDFESKIDPGLQAELDTIAAGIIDGSIDASSVSSP